MNVDTIARVALENPIMHLTQGICPMENDDTNRPLPGSELDFPDYIVALARALYASDEKRFPSGVHWGELDVCEKELYCENIFDILREKDQLEHAIKSFYGQYAALGIPVE
jgi:hypothetical protein